jgi:hypothetical protein
LFIAQYEADTMMGPCINGGASSRSCQNEQGVLSFVPETKPGSLPRRSTPENGTNEAKKHLMPNCGLEIS